MYDVFSYSLKSCVFFHSFLGVYPPWNLTHGNSKMHLATFCKIVLPWPNSNIAAPRGDTAFKTDPRTTYICRPDISKGPFCETSLKKCEKKHLISVSFWLSMWCCLSLAILRQPPLQQKRWKILGVFLIHGRHFVPKSQRSQFPWDAFHPQKNMP